MQAIRSDPERTLVARGPSTYGFRARHFASPRNDDHPSCPGLDPGIHQNSKAAIFSMDCRVKPGNDEITQWNLSMRHNSVQLCIALLLVAPLLAGCLERGQPTMADTSGDDDAYCRANNVAAGSPQYVACRK